MSTNPCFDIDAASEISDMTESLESSTDSDSGSDDGERQAEINAERNAVNLVAPSDLTGKVCFKHVKSNTLHFVERTLYDVKFFRYDRSVIRIIRESQQSLHLQHGDAWFASAGAVKPTKLQATQTIRALSRKKKGQTQCCQHVV